ncbi:UNVERIFIED_CONTAM: hypothetical protein FKN15_045160 [Acipenser sinensis]
MPGVPRRACLFWAGFWGPVYYKSTMLSDSPSMMAVRVIDRDGSYASRVHGEGTNESQGQLPQSHHREGTIAIRKFLEIG